LKPVYIRYARSGRTESDEKRVEIRFGTVDHDGVLVGAGPCVVRTLQLENREVGLRGIPARPGPRRDPRFEQLVVGLHVEDRERHPQFGGQRGECIAPFAFEEGRIDDDGVAGLDDRAREFG
jgi:hypothetical protein